MIGILKMNVTKNKEGNSHALRRFKSIIFFHRSLELVIKFLLHCCNLI